MNFSLLSSIDYHIAANIRYENKIKIIRTSYFSNFMYTIDATKTSRYLSKNVHMEILYHKIIMYLKFIRMYPLSFLNVSFFYIEERMYDQLYMN